MGLLKLVGSLLGGPQDSSPSQFPGSSFEVVIGFGNSDSKASGAATGILSRQLNSASSLITLEGVGPTSTVTKGNFLYFKCNSPMLLHVTYDDGVGGSVVSPMTVNGVVMVEADDDKFIKKLEAQGTGPLEYFLSGNQ